MAPKKNVQDKKRKGTSSKKDVESSKKVKSVEVAGSKEVMVSNEVHLAVNALRLFEESIFGWILGIEEMSFQAQLVHCLCFREAVSGDVESIVFKVGGKLLRFGLGEYAVMTLLKVIGNLTYPEFLRDDFRLTDTYFAENAEVERKVFRDFILNKRCKVDEDLAKMAIVFVISCFMNTAHKNLSREDFAMVEFGRYVDYPWGLAGYKFLVSSIKGKLTSKHALKTAAENKNFHYYVYGCPPVLMTWFL